ncbi:MAG: radical SAM protein [Clostridium sp.]|nr:radical SAM protein [Clostridium sp.]
MKIKMSFEDRAKKALINSICLLIERNPDGNIPKIFKLSKALIKDDRTKKILNSIEKSYEEMPSVKEFFDNSLVNINPEIRRNIFMNLVGNSNSSDNNKEKHIPISIILSPNNKCNLRCVNCSLSNSSSETLNFNDVDRVIGKAQRSGVNYIILFGGEPFLLDFMFKIYEKYSDIIFTPVTNGTLFTKECVNKLLHLGNIIPTISLDNIENRIDYTYGEGTFEKVVTGMNLLKDKGIPFGVSTAVSSANFSAVTSDYFIDMLIKNGSKFSIYSNSFCSNSHINKSISKTERLILGEKINIMRNTKPYFFIDLFNDQKYLEEFINPGSSDSHSFFLGNIPQNKLQSISLEHLIQSTMI